MAIPLAYNLRNLRVRLTTTLMTALGIALTVAVLLGVMALVNGLRGALEVTGRPDQVIVMRQGSTAELVSAVQAEKFRDIALLDGIAQRDGQPMLSHEIVSVVSLRLRDEPDNPETEGNVNIRGVSPMGRYLRDDLKLTEGRWFEPGKREVVVGQGVHAIRANSDIGDKITFGRDEWEVVGVFEDGRSAYNSEIWCDGNLATLDLGRNGTRSSVLLRATDEAAAQAIIRRVQQDQRLLLEGQLEREYYAKQMSSAGPVQALGVFVAMIMAVGSCFAAMNTMYTAVARRSREVGTLRLLGFSRASILLSFVLESLFLSLTGGLLGCLLVLPLNGLQSRIGNQLTFSETTFSFQITPESVAMGLGFAAVMGVVGGLLPARLAAGRSILASLRGG
ncbi:MAG: FtsX-like permease family protein [Acidobacteria bacterium]|nr:FtsX-like permease family protein [Acidobacteriota bacterium]